MTFPPDAPPGWGGYPDQRQQLHPSPKFGLLSEIEQRPIHWIEKPFLLDSTFHLLVGKKAAGKGLWLADLAARITRGELGDKRGVLWLSMSEDSYATDISPRIQAAGGELADVVCLLNHEIHLPEQIEILEAHITDEIALVVIDPLVGTMSGRKSSNSDSDVRPMLQALNRLADRKAVLIIGIRHISIKAGRNGDDPIASVLGSTAWVDVPRMVLGVFRDDADPLLRHLFVLEGNRTPIDTPGVVFQIEDTSLSGHEDPVPHIRLVGQSRKDPAELL